MKNQDLPRTDNISSTALSAEGIEKRFLNKIIFKSVNFALASGSSLAITGRNGSGKSTLLKVIAGLLKPNKGKVIIRAADREVEQDKRHLFLGMMSPYLNLYDELTAYENLEFFCTLKCGNISSGQRSEKVNSLLERVGLFGRRNDQLKNYSSGMKQRVKLAFAVINDPPVLLLDEPRTNLDREGIELVYSLSEEQKKRGILIIATNESEDTRLCSEILNIEDFR